MKIFYLLRFKRIRKYYHLCAILEMTPQQLDGIIAHPQYKVFVIPKKSGGSRSISAPGVELKIVQRKLLPYLMELYHSVKPACVHGFIHRKGPVGSYHIKSNATEHVGKKYVLNIDLADFFHSISTERVQRLFQEKPFSFPKAIATALALLCCYQRRLPMGAPTSPILSNLACIALDKALMELSAQEGFTYTRYADDLTFSSDTEITDAFTAEVQRLIEEQGFTVNASKVRLQTHRGRQWVTGIKVNSVLNVNRTYVRNVRAVLHDVRTRSVEEAARTYLKLPTAHEMTPEVRTRFWLSLKGKIDFIGFVKGKDDAVYQKFRQHFQQLS